MEQAGPPACRFGVAEGMLAVLGNMLVLVPIPSPVGADPLWPISSLFDLCTLLVIIVFPVFMRIKQAEDPWGEQEAGTGKGNSKQSQLREGNRASQPKKGRRLSPSCSLFAQGGPYFALKYQSSTLGSRKSWSFTLNSRQHELSGHLISNSAGTCLFPGKWSPETGGGLQAAGNFAANLL